MSPNKVCVNYDYFTLTTQLLRLCHPILTAPGNGGITPTYRWTQTLSDLMIMVPLPEGTKTKALDIVFTNNKLKVNFKPLLLLIGPFLLSIPPSFHLLSFFLPSFLPASLLPFFLPTLSSNPPALFLSPPHTSPLPSILLLLQVAVKGQTPIINGGFHKRVIVDDSFWTIEDGEFGKDTVIITPCMASYILIYNMHLFSIS